VNSPIATTIEDAGFAAWPCFEEEYFEGWRLRFADGFTKRANSANAGHEAKLLTDVAMDEIEGRYRAREIETVFRLCSWPTSSDIDARLASRGYRAADHSLVMSTEISADQETNLSVKSMDAERWLDTYHAVSGKSTKQASVHLRLLRAMPASTFFAVKFEADTPVACGIGVVTGKFLGLFEIATKSTHQGQGFATQLCRSVVAWGARQGAKTAYLQVEEINTRAIQVYERLGFRTVYRYWYRILPKNQTLHKN
jgi:N-acetylglutamate synthase